MHNVNFHNGDSETPLFVKGPIGKKNKRAVVLISKEEALQLATDNAGVIFDIIDADSRFVSGTSSQH